MRPVFWDDFMALSPLISPLCALVVPPTLGMQDLPPTGAIDLMGATVEGQEAAKTKHGFSFSVRTAKGVAYPMRVQTESERTEWAMKIGAAIAQGVSANFSVRTLPLNVSHPVA